MANDEFLNGKRSEEGLLRRLALRRFGFAIRHSSLQVEVGGSRCRIPGHSRGNWIGGILKQPKSKRATHRYNGAFTLHASRARFLDSSPRRKRKNFSSAPRRGGCRSAHPNPDRGEWSARSFRSGLWK